MTRTVVVTATSTSLFYKDRPLCRHHKTCPRENELNALIAVTASKSSHPGVTECRRRAKKRHPRTIENCIASFYTSNAKNLILTSATPLSLTRVIERLKELGYNDEDLDSDRDDDAWPWECCFSGIEASTLNEGGMTSSAYSSLPSLIILRSCCLKDWQSIKPQLEETIQLRWSATKVRDSRRRLREQEMKERFAAF